MEQKQSKVKGNEEKRRKRTILSTAASLPVQRDFAMTFGLLIPTVSWENDKTIGK